MRLCVAAFALVASVQFVGFATAEPLADVAAKKAVEESVAAPLTEFWKDVYDAVVRKQGAVALRKLRYKLASMKNQDPYALAKFLMDKLKNDVFEGSVNEEMWDAMTMELYFALKEWWSATPENPKEAADLGSWHSLVKVYKELLAPALRGSDRVGVMNELLLDPELKNIRDWVDEWKGAAGKASRRNSVEAAGEGNA